jgi:hypothetical protein
MIPVTGGNERCASLEYFKTYVPRLNIPLIATVDFGGYRIVATSKLPVEKIIFAEDGEVRRITEEVRE